MRIFVTGGSGVLGRHLVPMVEAAGHTVYAPPHSELELFDEAAVTRAAQGADAVYHLATRIPPPGRTAEPGAWDDNNRLRAQVTPCLVDAAIETGATVFIYPSITFVYPAEGPVDEDTPVAEGAARMSSTLVAEAETRRFADTGRRGVVLRLGLLWGPGTGSDAPDGRYGASLHISDAAAALAAALDVPSGLYNVVGDGQRVSNERFKKATGWRPER